MYPISKYKFYQTANRDIIAVSSYAGKTVKGVAKLHPYDIFNEEFGKELAVARCAVKVARKRCARAQKKVELAKTEVYTAQDYLKKMEDYEQDAYNELREAISNLTEIKARK